MPSPIGTTSPVALQPALELIYLATLQPELASQNLRKLVLANPDYFNNLPESSFKIVLKIAGDTAFERLSCVSYVPLLDQLYASVELKRDWGYSLGLRNSSSREYVRFYISLNGGATWQNEGLTAMHVNDEPGARPRIHLLTKRIELREKLPSLERPPLIRAILSWNSPPPPDAPDWAPLWGNALDTQIHTVRPNACRTDRLQHGPWDQFAGEPASEGRVGRASDSSDTGPVGVPTPAGLPSRRERPAKEFPALSS